MKAVRLAAILLIIGLAVYVLMTAQSLILPLVVAVVIWYFVNAIAGFICRFKIIPKWLALLISSLVIILLMAVAIEIIELSIESMIAKAPKYQQRFGQLIVAILDLLHIEKLPSVAEFVQDFNIQPALQQFGKEISNVAGQVLFVIIYTIFLLLEQSTFPKKLLAMSKDEKHHRRMQKTLTRINNSVKTYITIKTLICLAQATLAYVVMLIEGLDFAIFWAFLIFLLNYIPTFGSMIGTILPTAFGLLQFENYTLVIGMGVIIWAVQFLLANLVEPKLMGNTLNISTVVVLISLSLWGFIWGVPGMIFSVPIMVILIIFCAEFPSTRPIAILLSSNGEIPRPSSEEVESESFEKVVADPSPKGRRGRNVGGETSSLLNPDNWID